MTDVRYILEVEKGGKVQRAIALPIVTEVRKERVPTSVLTWTLGDDPIREFAGVREKMYTLSGTSGYIDRLGYDAQGNRLFASGPKLFREFEQFLEDYENDTYSYQKNLAITADTPTDAPRLVLRALWEGDAALVEQAGFQWDRSLRQGRFMYEYVLALRAYGEPTLPSRHTRNLLGGASNVLKKSQDAIRAATTSIALATEFLQDTRSSLDQYRKPVQSIYRGLQEVRRLAGAAQSLRTWPRAFAEDVWRVTNAETQAIYDSWAALPFVDRQQARAGMLDALKIGNEARSTFLSWLGQNYVKVDTRGPTPGANAVNIATSRVGLTAAVPTVVYEVTGGQTIYDVAYAVTGSRENWKTIADINGMTSPYTLPDGSPLTAGVQLLVPADIAALEATTQNPDDIYGIDLKVGADGDLVLQGDDNIALSRGVDNLTQAIYIRSVSFQGDNATFPLFGFPSIIGDGGTAETAGYLASHARSQYESDPRIKTARNIEVDDQGDSYFVTATLTPVGGAAFQVKLPIQGN